MHPIQQQWCEDIKVKFSKFFKGKRVLDIGSLNINGDNRYLFEDCVYIGLDVIAGENVDVVSIAHEYKPLVLFDVVLSTNALEHDVHYPRTLQKMIDVLKSGGLLFFSVATSWREHGTKRTSPSQSGTSQMGKEWENYYKNLTEQDIRTAIDIDLSFNRHAFSVRSSDLRFWGIKS